MLLSQIIQLTLQGEGKYVGEPTIFYRTTNCNLKCGFCDTRYSWDNKFKKEWINYNIDDLVKDFPEDSKKINCCITGGEPLLHQDSIEFHAFLMECSLRFKRLIIETNGTIYPNKKMSYLANIVFSVSPKLKSSGVNEKKRFNHDTLQILNTFVDSYFKFVIKDESDIDELISKFKHITPEKIYLMPEGKTIEELNKSSQFVIEQCLKYKFKFADRLHIVRNLK